MATPSSACTSHPAAAAGWRCEQCQALLCPACVEGRRAGTVEYEACGACGGTASVLRVHRARRDFARRLPGALRFPFTLPGLQTLVAVSAVLAVLRSLAVGVVVFHVLPLALALGIFWSVFFAVVRGAARGDADPELPGFTQLFQDTLLPGLRGLGLTAGVFGPALVYVFALRPSAEGPLEALLAAMRVTLPPSAWDAPLTVPLVALGFAWLPWALLASASGHSLLGALHPGRALRYPRALGADAGVLLGVFAGLLTAHLGLHLAAAGVRWLALPFLSTWLSEALTLIVPLAFANVLGLLLYVRGDALGYLPAHEYLEAALGDAAPERRAEAFRASAPLPAPEPEPVADASDRVAELDRAMAARDVPAALAAYRGLMQVTGIRLLPEQHLFVGQAAAVEEDFPLSVTALESAADVAPDHALAPRALVLLARVQGERLGNAVRAEEIYRYIVHRYPDTEAARFAHARLPPAE